MAQEGHSQVDRKLKKHTLTDSKKSVVINAALGQDDAGESRVSSPPRLSNHQRRVGGAGLGNQADASTFRRF